MPRIFLDTDVLLNVILKREIFYIDSAEVLSLVQTREARGFTSSLVLCNLHYIVARLADKRRAMEAVGDLMEILEVLPVDQDILSDALAAGFSDFEDAVESKSAEKAKVDYIITRNIGDFKRSKVKVISPADFLNILG